MRSINKKSNFLIGPSALWWRDAFAISSSLLRGDDDGEDNKNNSEEKEDDAYENDDAAMADLGHAAEATLDLARVVSGTLLADLRRCAMLISFFLPFAFEFDSSGGVLRVYLVLLFVSRGVLSSTHFAMYTPLTTVLWTGRRGRSSFGRRNGTRFQEVEISHTDSS